MKNPYDIYSDNRAYHGFLRGIEEIKDKIRLKRATSSNKEVVQVLDEIIKEIEDD